MTVAIGRAELENLQCLLELARAEDLGDGDVTSRLLPAELHAAGRFLAREELIFCGGFCLHPIADAYDPEIRTDVKVADGQEVAAGAVLATWTGRARPMLSAERVALNFLQHLSGIATVTRRYVQAVAGTGAAVLDTRKTTPGWRALAKYAVRAGGGTNHRKGLYDAVLVKDNHLSVLRGAGPADAMGRIAGRFDEVRERLGPDGFIEIEVGTLEELERALKLPVDMILLDNMQASELREAAAKRDAAGLRGRVALEASGGITLENICEIAETGVERISVGALTHSVRAVDIALDVEFG